MNTKNLTVEPLAKLTFAVCCLIQIILIIVFWDVKQTSDPEVYIKLAEDCHSAGEWYPQAKDLYSIYYVAPGLINFFILQLKLFGTVQVNMIFNLLMAVGISYFIFKIAEYYFTRKTAFVALALWSMMYSTWMSVLAAQTEVPFLFLTLAAFYIALYKDRWYWFLLAGILLSFANWIRPLVIVFLPVILLAMAFRKMGGG